MACVFAWCWNKTPYSVYFTDSNIWDLPNTNRIFPNNTNIFSRLSGFSGYAFTRCLRVQYQHALIATLPGGAVPQGSYLTRYFHNSSLTSPQDWWRFQDASGNTKVAVRQVAASGSTTQWALYVEGVAVGTTTGSYGNNTQWNIAVQWDGNPSANPAVAPSAKLFIQGVEVVSGNSGNLGNSFSIGKVRFRSNDFNQTYTDGWSVWDSLADDPARTTVYVLPLLPNADVTTTNWSSTGANFHSVLSDGNVATYANSTTTPATGNLQMGLESMAQVDAGWTSGTIHAVGVQAATYGDGVLTSVAVGLDSNGTSATSSGFTTSINNQWAYHLSNTDPDTSAAWTEAGVTAVTTLFEGS